MEQIDITDKFAQVNRLQIERLRYTSAFTPYVTPYQVTVSDAALAIDNLYIRFAGAFSNSLIQLSVAMSLAINRKIPHIYLSRQAIDPIVKKDPFWYLQRGALEYLPGQFVHNTDVDPATLEGVTMAGDFFDVQPIAPLYGVYHRNAHLLLKRWMLLDFARHDFADDDLFLYLRAGNAFMKVPDTGIAQPPLVFYQRILASRPWRSVHVVYENFDNPVVEPLIAHCRASGVPTVVHSESLKDDIEVLLSARTVTASRGTFLAGIASISDRMTTLYDFNGGRTTGLYPDRLKVFNLSDKEGGYIDALYRHNWRNTPEQRALMLSYQHVDFD